MFKVLWSFGFGNDFCRWIDTFYENIKSTVIVNGQIAQWFGVERVCRQGDPISLFLFILRVEILAIMTREDSEIKRNWINKVEHNISQFADDTQLMNNGDTKSVQKSIEVVSTFGKVSGQLFKCGQNTSYLARLRKRFTSKTYATFKNCMESKHV